VTIPDKEAVMETRNIRQSVTFKATPHAVYEMLMDSRKHSVLAGDEAKISRKVGGKFNVGGYIEGVMLDLVPDEKIVQTWRYEDWPKGHYSKATFSLKAAEGKKTKMAFTQTGVPAKFYEDIKQGWIDYYWAPMKEMLEIKSR
jgi:activator of HSP90 ATPase